MGEIDNQIKKAKKEIDSSEAIISSNFSTLEKNKKTIEAGLDEYKDASQERIKGYTEFLNNYTVELRHILITVVIIIVILFLISLASQQLLEYISFAILVAVIIYLLHWRLPSKISSEDFVTDTDSAKLDTAINSSLDLSGSILEVVRKLSPHLDAIISLNETKTKQRIFKITLINSLQRLGIILEDGKLINLGISAGSEESEQWLNSVSKNISESLDINQDIIRLSYYDYIGDMPNVNNTWKSVKRSSKILLQLVNYIVANRYANANHSDRYNQVIAELLSKNDFSTLGELDGFISKFYNDLYRQKLDLISTFKNFSLSQKIEESITEFIPENSDYGDWGEQIIKKLAMEFKIPEAIIKLFLFANTFEFIKRKEEWDKISGNLEMRNKLAQIFIENEFIDFNSKYLPQIDNVKSNLIEIFLCNTDFSLYKIINQFNVKIEKIENEKMLFLQAVKAYNVSELDRRDELDKLLPTGDIKQVKEKIAEVSSRLSGVDSEILLLFYSQYTNQERETNRLFKKIISDKKAGNFANVLLNLNLIYLNPNANIDNEIHNLGELLESYERESYDKFSLNDISNKFSTFSDLIKYNYEISEFLYNEELSKDNKPMPTSKVADLVVDRSRRSIDFSEKLREICNFNLKQNTKYTTTPKTFDSVIIASLSCCLKYQEDKKHGPTFYKEAGQDELASKILYAYYNELEALNYESNKGVKLAKIIDKVTDNSYEEKYWEPLQIFSSRLATGFLPTRTFQLYEKRSENVNEIILRQRDVLEKMLSSLKGSVHDFFDSQFNNNIISHSLNAKIVSAYLVTTASSTPLMGALNEFFDEAISELSKKNKIYSEVIFETNTSERTGAGKATRIGVVPPHTTFEEHFLLIRNVIDLVIKKHKDSKGSDKNYAYNVIKINPSMSDFKHISEIVEKTNPINIIKELVVSRFDAIDNFGILATMKGTQEEKLALRDIIREFFTSAKATNIYSLVKEDLGGLSISNKIRDLLENGKLQELLLISYSKKSLWEFCSVIYELTQKLNEKETKKQLSMKIAEIFKNQGIKYEANDLENLAVLIYTKMYNIGNVLSI